MLAFRSCHYYAFNGNSQQELPQGDWKWQQNRLWILLSKEENASTSSAGSQLSVRCFQYHMISLLMCFPAALHDHVSYTFLSVHYLTSSCFFSWNNGFIFLLCSSCEHSTCSTSINENHVFLWPTLHACWIKCPKSFKRTDFWWYAQVSLIYLPHVCPWKNHSLSLCAGECSRWKAWNVKLYHHQPFFLCAGPNCFFLLVCVCERERVWDKVSIYNLQKEGPPPGLAICHPGTCRGCSLVRLKRWNH